MISEKLSYLPGAEPFFFCGSEVGCLVIHGFTASPREVRPLGEHLAKEGYTVLGVRLTGHGTRPDDLRRSGWRDWLGAAIDGLHLLHRQCKTIFVMGLSMGGVTAIHIAAHYPVAGIVAMATPILVPRQWHPRLMPLLEWFRPYVKKRSAGWTEQMYSDNGRYAVRPVRAVRQLFDYMRAADALLPAVTVPALLMHSKNDDFVRPENLPHIYARLGSQDKEMLWLEKSGHVLTEDVEQQIVFEKASVFVRAHLI